MYKSRSVLEGQAKKKNAFQCMTMKMKVVRGQTARKEEQKVNEKKRTD